MTFYSFILNLIIVSFSVSLVAMERFQQTKYSCALVGLTALELMLLNSQVPIIELSGPNDQQAAHEFIKSTLKKAFPTVYGDSSLLENESPQPTIDKYGFLILATLFYQNYKILTYLYKKDQKVMNVARTLIVTPAGYLLGCLLFVSYGAFVAWLQNH